MMRAKAVAVYARISSDEDGTGLGVSRQLQDCRRLVEDLGWTLAEEYVDNDLSAYSGKLRPAYERMVSDLADGSRDALVAYHVDRLSRRPLELERLFETLLTAGVRNVRFAAGGELDLANGDGLFMIRVQGAVAAHESATKSRRVRRKMDEVAAAGRPHGGSRRPFGYEDDCITVRESEAAIIRTLVDRFLAGESWRSLANWLNDEGVPTSAGGTWHTSTLRQMLAGGRIAGLRRHRGQIIGPAVWEPIITEAQRAQILATMAQRKATNRRSPRTYLLSGLLRCGRCGGRLYSAARPDRRRYVCVTGPDHGGCGGIMVTAPLVEDLITGAVLYRLDTPALADALAGKTSNDETQTALADELADDQRQLAELAHLYAEKAITAAEWMTARKPIEARIDTSKRRLARSSGNEALARIAGTGEQLGAQWADLPLTRQHAVISAVLDHAIVDPAQRSGGGFDPQRVRPIWRL